MKFIEILMYILVLFAGLAGVYFGAKLAISRFVPKEEKPEKTKLPKKQKEKREDPLPYPSRLKTVVQSRDRIISSTQFDASIDGEDVSETIEENREQSNSAYEFVKKQNQAN